MPALKPTEFTARVTYLGCVGNRDASLRAAPLDAVLARFSGVDGEDHGGLTRPACSRVSAQHPVNTEIRNVRQFSVLSAEELALTAAQMGIAAIDPSWVGASLVIEGIPDFTYVPPSSRLQGPSGVTLVIDMENRPCHLAAREIEAEHAGSGKLYKPAAAGRRGVTAWVEREGLISLGDELRLHIPDQPVWPHLDAARGL